VAYYKLLLIQQNANESVSFCFFREILKIENSRLCFIKRFFVLKWRHNDCNERLVVEPNSFHSP